MLYDTSIRASCLILAFIFIVLCYSYTLTFFMCLFYFFHKAFDKIQNKMLFELLGKLDKYGKNIRMFR